MATFTHRLSSQAKLQHLPLADALKTYAGAREQAKLAALLEPVRRAAEQSKRNSSGNCSGWRRSTSFAFTCMSRRPS